MTKIDKHIEIVRTSVKSLSAMSQKSCDGIQAALSKYYTRVGVTTVDNIADLETLAALKPDLVFIGMKFVPINPTLGSNDPNGIWLTTYLDEQGIAYTGSSRIAHQLELNKPLAKQCVIDAGLNTSQYFEVKQNQPHIENTSVEFPLFVKPTNRGGGLGIDSSSVVYNHSELKAKIAAIASNFQSDSLVESYLPGREFSVAILKDELSNEFSVMPLELIAPEDGNGVRILSEQVKTNDTESFAEVTDEIIRLKINRLALDVFHALSARDYGRIDIRMDAHGVPQFLEANLTPSLIKDYGNFPKACKLNINLDFEPMLLTIVRLALKRAPKATPKPILLHTPVVPSLETALDPI